MDIAVGQTHFAPRLGHLEGKALLDKQHGAVRAMKPGVSDDENATDSDDENTTDSDGYNTTDSDGCCVTDSDD